MDEIIEYIYCIKWLLVIVVIKLFSIHSEQKKAAGLGGKNASNDIRT